MRGKWKAGRLPAEQQDWEQTVQNSYVEGDLHQTVNVGAASPEALRPEVFLGHVRELVPERLDAREAELAELAAFCFGNEPYVWWVAEAWSGKTALLAWFVLHPPDGVDVLHFFVRGGESYWSDSTAFNTWLHAQLTTYLDATPSDTKDPRQLHAEWEDLLRQALDSAETAGRCLLLVVDGIDEDQGRNRAEPLPSILSLLPREPALRVVLAGRPQYDLPTDVTGHPVLTCRGRLLDGSARAASLYREARLELDTLLRSGGQLAKDILGFTVASEGAVSTAEIAELTNTWEHYIRETIVNGGGRALRVTTFPDGGDGFVFTHETLREQAQAFLGEAMLNAYRERVNDWASRYREAHWPDSTPFFLVARYGKLLADTGGLAALTDLALDPARHALMRRKIGGDGTALTDIITAQLQWSRQRDPDLASAVRLARTRWELTRPNLHMPEHLPAVWALLGQPERAVALIDAIAGAGQQTAAQRLLVDALLRVGKYTAAIAETEAMNDGEERTAAQEQLIGALLRVGAYTAAAEAACTIEESGRRAASLLYVATATLRAGDADLAEGMIAVALDDCGEEDGTKAFVDYARLRGPDYARAIQHPGLRDGALCLIVEEYAEHGHVTEAADLANEVRDELLHAYAKLLVAAAGEGSLDQNMHLRLMELIEAEPDFREPVLGTMSCCFALKYNYRQVWDTVSLMKDPVQGCLPVIDLYVKREAFDQAEGLAKAMADTQRSATPIDHLGTLLVSAGALDRAVAIAKALAERLPHVDGCVRVLADIGAQLVMAGDRRGLLIFAAAEPLADTSRNTAGAAPFVAMRFAADSIERILARGRPAAYAALAIAAARTGDLAATTRYLRIVADSHADSHQHELLFAAKDIARSGHEDAAMCAIDMLEHPVGRASAALVLGKAAVAQERPETARRAALFAARQRFIDTQLDVEDPDFNPREVDSADLEMAGALFAEAAWVLAAAGATDEASQMVLRAEAAARQTIDTDREDSDTAFQAATYSHLADFPYAENLARGITDAETRCAVLLHIAIISAQRGDGDTAIRLAAEMQDDGPCGADELQEVTHAFAAAGHLAQASRAAELIADPDDRAAAIAVVADTHLTAGDAEFADRLITSATELLTQAENVQVAETAAALAATAIRAHRPDRVAPLEHRLRTLWQRGIFHARLATSAGADHAQAAATIAKALDDPYERSMVYNRLAAAWAAIGDGAMVTQMINAALYEARASRRGDAPSWLAETEFMGIDALVQVGLLDHAEQLLDPDLARAGRGFRVEKRSAYLAQRLAEAGHFDHAIRVAESISKPFQPGLWNELTETDQRDAALGAIVTVMATVGGLSDRALTVADMIGGPVDRANALAEIARSLARQGRPVRARQLLASALALGEWTAPLRALAEVAPDVAQSVLPEIARNAQP